MKSDSLKYVPQIKVFNYSKVFGGQEKYIEYLFNELALRKLPFLFCGGPDKLKKFVGPQNFIEGKFLSIELLNGNRALYKHSWFSRKSNIRIYVQHSHVDDGQDYFFKRWIRKGLFQVLLKRMDVVIRVCEHSLPDILAPGKIHTVYNGISLPALPKEHYSRRPFTLLMVGAVNENKNQLLALQLLEQDSDLHLIIVGDGDKLEQYKRWASERGLNARLQWTGFVDDPAIFYRQADVLLMLSAFEAFPYAVLEAMAHALPVVATKVGGVPEAIKHEQEGLLLQSRDLPALSSAIQQLKSDPQKCEQFGRQARQTVRDRFTVEKMADNLLCIIDEVARKKGFNA